MEDDWDLQAVVRGCTTTTTITTATTTNTTTTSSSTFTADLNPRSFYSSIGFEQDDHFLSLPDPFETRSETIEELHDLYKPFFPKPQTLSLHTNPISSLSSTLLESKVQQQQQQQPKQSLVGSRTTAPSTTTRTHSQTTPRSKRRKNQQKKVCQVPAEGLSSDMWAWRKYGQKPIKGSPYPRGYYRCSSSKGCLARKQVERNRSDPDMFIVTYTAEHNHPAPTHRNSLAGSTRQKPFTPQTAVAGDGNNKSTTKPSCSSPVSPPAALSPATSLTEEDLVQQSKKTEDEDVVEEDEDDELGFSDMVITDDFFVGLEELAVPATDGYFSDPFPASFPFSCLVNKTATAAGGG